MNTIRDMREQKNLSEDAVAAAAGLTYGQFVRIQAGSGKTTDAEVRDVLKVIKGMEPGKRKLGGRPFKDPAKRAAVEAARAAGTSVAAVIAGEEDLIGTPVAPAKRVRKPRPRKTAIPATE